MRALIVVDLQPDFMPGGPLGVPGGDEVVEVVNRLAPRFDLVVATQDWHPADHGSFAANHDAREPGQVIDLHGLEQVLWPVHCVQDTPGAALVGDLEAELAAVFQKGSDPKVDSYSGFYDNGKRNSTGLADWLREHKVDEVAVVGLAMDYCVKFTALDAIAEGLRTHLVTDACRAVNLQPGDGERALAEIVAAGGRAIDSQTLLDELSAPSED